MELATVAPSEHVVLVFLCQVLALLIVARLLGWLMGRFGQPSVVGELLAGVVLGPSLLGRLSPPTSEWLFPDDAVQGAMLYGLAWIGLLLLLAATGFESDLSVIRKLGRPALFVTAGSLLIPLAGGLGAGLVAPDALLGPNATTFGFAAFLAVALSISSLPVVAKVLAELGLVRRNVGQLILAVAVANDVVGWILLGVVAGLAEADGIAVSDLVVTVLGVAAFLVLALTLGQRAVDQLLSAVASSSPTTTTPAVAVIGLVIGAGALTQWMGVEAVLGAFIAGLLVGRSRWRDERALRLVESVAHGVLAPLFFATAGLRIDLGVFTQRTVAIWSIVIIAVASVTKFAGALIGAQAGRLPRREGLALGAALNARGALEIVIASIGLGLGVLNDASYGVIVVMAIVTSLAAPPLLRAVLTGWSGTEEEQERLRAEQIARSRIVLSDRPPLLVTRGRPPSITAAQLIALCWPERQRVTVLTTSPDIDLTPIEGVLYDRPLRMVLRDAPDPAGAILAEADKGHGAIVLGLTDRPDGPILSPFVESILAGANRPVILIRPDRISGRPLPAAFARAIVPVTGSVNSRAAQELAFAMSASIGTQLTLTHLDPTPPLYGRDLLTRLSGVAEPLLLQAVETARLSHAGEVVTLSRTTDSVPGELVKLSVEYEADVVIVGTTPRASGDLVHLGPVVTHLLHTCPSTVIVVATPPGWIGHRL